MSVSCIRVWTGLPATTRWTASRVSARLSTAVSTAKTRSRIPVTQTNVVEMVCVTRITWQHLLCVYATLGIPEVRELTWKNSFRWIRRRIGIAREYHRGVWEFCWLNKINEWILDGFATQLTADSGLLQASCPIFFILHIQKGPPFWSDRPGHSLCYKVHSVMLRAETLTRRRFDPPLSNLTPNLILSPVWDSKIPYSVRMSYCILEEFFL